MTAAEEGVLLLCCRLGDTDCRPLTMAQFRELGLRVRSQNLEGSPLSDLTTKDLCRLGYEEQDAARITALLDRTQQLHNYLAQAERLEITALTRASDRYPRRISVHRKLSSPPVLFARGDLSLLDLPSAAVIGSRQLYPENQAFAETAGRLCAEEGLVLVSGGANGADRTAQNACLEAGGFCIIVVADRLLDHAPHPRCLYLSEDGYEIPFSPARALHRNAIIHMQGDKTLAAQCTYGKGGTWEGSLENLKHGWSPLFVFDDGYAGSRALMERGATGIRNLTHIASLQSAQIGLF